MRKFLTLLVLAVCASPFTSANAIGLPTVNVASSKTRLIIRDAQINVGSIQKFTSKAGKVHIQYSFTVAGESYQAIVYSGQWNSTTLSRLRSGRASLIGTWTTYQGRPSFVTEQVQ